MVVPGFTVIAPGAPVPPLALNVTLYVGGGGLLTVNVPQLAVLVAVPQVASTLISLYVPETGLLQSGAFVQVGVPRVP